MEDESKTAFEGTSSDPNSLNAKLPMAPWWASLYSLALYTYLWGAGLAHVYRAAVGTTIMHRVLGDATLLCAVYMAESVLALSLKRSTMLNWRRIDFMVHHIPYCAIVGCSLVFELPLDMYRFGLPLSMCTSLNEAIAASRALGAPAWIDIPNRFYLLTLMTALVLAEVPEFGSVALGINKHVGVSPVDYTWPVRVLALFSLAAPAYHGIAVLPHCWKIVKRWTAKKIWGEPTSKVTKVQ